MFLSGISRILINLNRPSQKVAAEYFHDILSKEKFEETFLEFESFIV